jgi:site-specific recombinase XerD
MTLRFDVYEKNKNLKAGYRVYAAVVTYMKDGKQRRKTFKCVEQAKLFHAGLAQKEKTVGKRFWDLSPQNAEVAFSAWERAEKGGYQLLEALTYFEAATGNTSNEAIGEVADIIINVKSASQVSISYKRSFETIVRWLADLDPEKGMDSFSTADIDKAVDDKANGWSLRTRQHKKRHLSIFFNMAVEMKLCRENPVKYLNKKTTKKALTTFIDFVTPKEAEIIMAVVAKHRPQFVPAFALVLYNGLRMYTAARMIAADIHLEHDKVRIPDCIDKAYGRTIDLTPKCRYWMERYLKYAHMPALMPVHNGEEIIPEKLAAIDNDALEIWKYKCDEKFNGHRKMVVDYIKRVDGGRWPKNGCRHGFITHYLQLTQDAQKTAYAAGNTPKMINEHYDGKLFDANQVKEYFAVAEEAENIIKLNTAKVA